MARYKNQQKNFPIQALEFAKTPEGNFCFFYLESGIESARARSWLDSLGKDVSIMAETQANGGDIIIARSIRSEEEFLKELNDKGGNFTLPPLQEKKMDPWVVRGKLSIVGQSLQLASAYTKEDGIDSATAGFAISNLAANLTNIIFGGEKSKDRNHLVFLKNKVNLHLASHVGNPDDLPQANEVHKTGRTQEKKVSPLFKFLQRYSVTFGEIGLRMFGAFCMVFPVAQMKGAFSELRKGSLSGAFEKGYNHKDKVTATVGITYLIGKTIALMAKAPDPYNPKPQTAIDKLREKVLFKISSVIEGAAAGVLSYDRFAKRKITLKKFGLGETKYPDFLGGVGGALFTGALGMRYFANYGERLVDMDELRAHTVDSLALVPREKLPQAVAETAAMLSDHFGKEKVPFGDFYTKLVDDLKKYHHKEVDAVPVRNAQVCVPVPASVPPLHTAEHAVEKPKTFAQNHLKKTSAPAHAFNGFGDRVALTADPAQFSLN